MRKLDPKLYVQREQDRKAITDWQLETKLESIPNELKAQIGRREVPCPICGGGGFIWLYYVSPSTGKWYAQDGGYCECRLCQNIFGKLDRTVPPHYRYVSLSTLQPSEQSMLPLDYQRELLKEMREHPDDSYAFFGPAGTSKTTLTTALYRRAVVADEIAHWNKCTDMVSACWRVTVKQLTDEFVHFATAKDIIDDDGVHHRAKEPTVTRRKIAAASLAGFKPRLFIEEIDKMKGSEFKQQELFEVLNGLYEHDGQLVINTNMTKEEFSQEFGAAFERRIAERCRVKDFFGVAA